MKLTATCRDIEPLTSTAAGASLGTVIPRQKTRFAFLGKAAILLSLLAILRPAFAGNGLVAWGDNTYGLTNVPPGATNITAIAAGGRFVLALRGDRTVMAWGAAGYTNVPAGLSNVVAIAAGRGHSLALKNDGTLAAWGIPTIATETNIPPGLSNVLAIACGDDHNLVLKSDGTVYAWGENYSHQTNIPANLSNVVVIAAGDSANLAIENDGTAWSSSAFYPTNVASISNAVAGALVAGPSQGAIIESDGAARVWGFNRTDIAVVSNAVAVAGRSAFNQAGAAWVLRRDGTLAGFGSFYLGQSNVWMNLSNVVAIAAGYDYHVAVVGDSLPMSMGPMTDFGFTNGQFVVMQPTSLGNCYRLEYQDSLSGPWQIISPLPGNGSTQALADPAPSPVQRFYRISARP
jgi:hypothetical protein